MKTEYHLLADAARVLNCAPHHITYLLSTRQVPEPVRIGGRRIFTTDDLALIGEALKPRLAGKSQVKGGKHAE